YDTSSEAQLPWMIEDAAAERGLVSTREHADSFTAAAAAAGLPEPKLRVWEEGAFAELAAAGRDISDEQLEAARSQATGDSLATLISGSVTTGKSQGCGITRGKLAPPVPSSQLHIPEVFRVGMRCLLFRPQALVFARLLDVLAISSGAVLAN